MIINWIFEGCAICETFSHRTKPYIEDPILNPNRPSGLFAGKVHRTISLSLSTPGKGLTHGLKASKIGSFAFAKLKLNIFRRFSCLRNFSKKQ